jgi:hypothetical protein
MSIAFGLEDAKRPVTASVTLAIKPPSFFFAFAPLPADLDLADGAVFREVVD